MSHNPQVKSFVVCTGGPISIKLDPSMDGKTIYLRIDYKGGDSYTHVLSLEEAMNMGVGIKKLINQAM